MGTVLGTYPDPEPEIIDGHCEFCPLRNHNTKDHICSICDLSDTIHLWHIVNDANP